MPPPSCHGGGFGASVNFLMCGHLRSISDHNKQVDGWWLGELKGQVGIFPATYVEDIIPK